MEDFSKPVSPYRGRGRGNYVPRTIFNPGYSENTPSQMKLETILWNAGDCDA